jgi:hypothetical protein
MVVHTHPDYKPLKWPANAATVVGGRVAITEEDIGLTVHLLGVEGESLGTLVGINGDLGQVQFRSELNAHVPLAELVKVDLDAPSWAPADEADSDEERRAPADEAESDEERRAPADEAESDEELSETEEGEEEEESEAPKAEETWRPGDLSPVVTEALEPTEAAAEPPKARARRASWRAGRATWRAALPDVQPRHPSSACPYQAMLKNAGLIEEPTEAGSAAGGAGKPGSRLVDTSRPEDSTAYVPREAAQKSIPPTEDPHPSID